MPIQTFYPDGVTTMFNSENVAGGVCLGAVRIVPGTSYSKSWPWLAGATMRIADVYGAPLPTSGVGSVSLSNSPYPSVSLGSLPYERTVLLWVTGSPGIVNMPGMQAVSSSGTVALHPSARGMNYLGKATYDSLTPIFYDSGTGQRTLASWNFSAPSFFTSDMQPVVVIDMSAGFFTIGAMGMSWDGSRWRGSISAFTSLPTKDNFVSLTAQTPDLYLFARPSAPAVGTAACAVYDDGNVLAFDLLAGPLLASKAVLSYSSGTFSLAAPSVTKLGIFGDPANWATERIEGFPQTTQDCGYWRFTGGNLVRSRGLWETYNDGDYAASSTYDIYTTATNVECFDLATY